MIVLGRDDFSRAVAREGGWEFVRLETKTFPDGESYFRITEPERLRNEKVVLAVRGRTPGLQQDKLVTESVIVLDRVREAGAGKICLFVPYLPYARQDREFLPGEAVSAKSVRNLLSERCDLLLSVSSHDFRKEGWIGEKMYNIDGTDSAIDFLRERELKDPIVIAPDMTAKDNVERLAKAIGGNTFAIKKERDRKTGEIKTFAKIPNLSGQELVIFDDVSSSGGTLYKAIQMGKKAKASKIFSVVIHALSVHNEKFGKNSIDLIRGECDEYSSSDTIESPVTKFSVVKQTARFLKESF